MLKRFVVELPAWAQPNHPVLRYMILRGRTRDALWWRLMRTLLQVIAAAIIVVFGYQIATGFGVRQAPSLHAVLYWPLVFLGVLVGLAAMTVTSNAISLEKSRGTWDSLRITSHGAELTFQARWIAAFYALRGPLSVLFLARLVFVVAILIDLMQYYRGRYLDLLLSGITPAVSVPVGAALLAALMTAAVLQPLVAVGLDAAVGLLVSILVREPRYNLLVRAALGAIRVLLVLGAIVFGSQAFALVEWMTPPLTWAGMLLQSVLGDQGLRLLNLEESGLIWAELEFGILIGLILLALPAVPNCSRRATQTFSMAAIAGFR